MHVGTDDAIGGIDHRNPAYADVFADLLHQGFAFALQPGGKQLGDIRLTRFEGGIEHGAHEGEKSLVPGDEIRLAVDLDEDAVAAVFGHARGDDAVRGGPAGLLGGFHAARLAQFFDGRVDVTVGGREGLLAFEQAKPRALTKLLYLGSRHSKISCGAARPAPLFVVGP